MALSSIKVALPRSHKHVSVDIALRHTASIPKATKPHITAYSEKQLIRWYARVQKRSYTTAETARAYRAWKLSQWARSVEKLATELQARPKALATLRREIMAENRKLWQCRDYRPFAHQVQIRSICEREFVILHEPRCDMVYKTGDRYMSYIAELWIPLAQYWQFHLSEEYQQWISK